MMQEQVRCPTCQQQGLPLGHDPKGREIFQCSNLACEIVEFDREVVRSRGGVTLKPLGRRRRRRRGEPKYWAYALDQADA